MVLTTDVKDEQGRVPSGRFEEEGIEVVRLPNLSNRLAYHHQLFLPRSLVATARELVSRCDVVHLHGFWHLLNNAALREARRQGRPVVLMPNGTLPAIERKLLAKRLWFQILGREVKEGATRFVAVSDAEVNQFVRAGVPRERVHIVHNGIDLAEFEAAPPRGAWRAGQGLGTRPLVVYLGKLTPRKGVDHLIAAIAKLRGKDAVLVVAGNDMGVLPSLRQRAVELGLADRVRFLGLVVGKERLSVLVDADVLVYPSTDEIFGLVPWEGLLAGAPVVVSDDCGCGELVLRAKAGELVRYGDVDGLAQAIDGLLEDPARRARMVARGRAFVADQLTWPRLATAMEAVYRRALADAPLESRPET